MAGKTEKIQLLVDVKIEYDGSAKSRRKVIKAIKDNLDIKVSYDGWGDNEEYYEASTSKVKVCDLFNQGKEFQL